MELKIPHTKIPHTGIENNNRPTYMSTQWRVSGLCQHVDQLVELDKLIKIQVNKLTRVKAPYKMTIIILLRIYYILFVYIAYAQITYWRNNPNSRPAYKKYSLIGVLS